MHMFNEIDKSGAEDVAQLIENLPSVGLVFSTA